MLKKIFILCCFLATVYFRNISIANQSFGSNRQAQNISEYSIATLAKSEMPKKMPLAFFKKDQGHWEDFSLLAQGHGSHLP